MQALLAVAIFPLAIAMGSHLARSACDAIPGAQNEFRGFEGATSSPFATPGQSFQVRVRPSVCDGASIGLGVAPDACLDTNEVRVTLVYDQNLIPNTPPSPRRLVVLATSCPQDGLIEGVWNTGIPGLEATCVVRGGSDLSVFSAQVPVGNGSDTVDECRLKVRMPRIVAGPGGPEPENPEAPIDPKLGPLTGPVRIVVDQAGGPLPFANASQTCSGFAASGSTIACIDQLFAVDGTCDTGQASQHPNFSHFLTLPDANVFSKVVSEGDPIRLALDDKGNVFGPFDWCTNPEECVLFQGLDELVIPPPQLISFVTSIWDGLSSGPREPVPSLPDEFYASYNAQGIRLPPLFAPLGGQVDGGTRILGSVDAPVSVVRVERTQGACSGSNAPCLIDDNCAAGEVCQLDPGNLGSAFDLSYCISQTGCVAPAVSEGAPLTIGGPAYITAPYYDAGLDGFVPLENLSVCADLEGATCVIRDETLPVEFASALALNGDTQVCTPEPPLNDLTPICRDVNGDGDISDIVLTLVSEFSGEEIPIGRESAGPAIATIFEAPPTAGPFAFPITERYSSFALASDERCVAVFVAEPDELRDGDDLESFGNEDGEVYDALARVVCNEDFQQELLDGGALGRKLAVRTTPGILPVAGTWSPLQRDLDPLVVMNEKAVFLIDELANATVPNEQVDLADAGMVPSDGVSTSPAIDGSGDLVCFASDAQNLVSERDKTRGGADIYCRDRNTLETFVVNRFRDTPKQRDLCIGNVVWANDPAANPAVAGSGETARICYDTTASNLIAKGGDKNKQRDVFVLDRCTCQTERVSLQPDGSEFSTPSSQCALAGAGDLAAFANGGDIYLQRITGDPSAGCGVGPTPSSTLRIENIDVLSVQSGAASAPSLAGNGSRIAFEVLEQEGTRVYLAELAGGPPFVPSCIDVDGDPGCDTVANPHLGPAGRLLTYENGGDLFVLDLVTGLPELVAQLGGSRDGEGTEAAVAFTTGPRPDVMLQDRTTLLSKFADPEVGTTAPSITPDGLTVAYAKAGEIWWSGPDRADPEAEKGGTPTELETLVAVLNTETRAVSVEGPAAQVAVGGDVVAYLDPAGRAFIFGGVGPLTVLGNEARAKAVATSDELVCLILSEDSRVACGAPDSAALTLFGDVRGEGIAVAGDRAVVLTQPSSPRWLLIFDVNGNVIGSPVPDVRHFVTDFGFVGADQCADATNPDRCHAVMVRLEDGLVFETGKTTVQCTDVCDEPFTLARVGDDNAKMRFLTDEGLEPPGICDLDGDGSCDHVIVQEVVFPADQSSTFVIGAVTAQSASALLGNAGAGGGTFAALVGRCEGDASLACQSDANCADQDAGMCGNREPSVLALADSDGDGIFDVFDNCPFVPNPGQENTGGSGSGDACDSSCGDGTVQTGEHCDYADTTIDPVTGQVLGSFCNGPQEPGPNCTPIVRLAVSENAVRPKQRGDLPTTIFGSPVLNLALEMVGDRPPQMIAPGSLLLEGVPMGGACTDGVGGGPSVDLTDPQRYRSKLVDFDSDGFVDLRFGVEVPPMDIDRGTDDEACLTGSFRSIPELFNDADFTSRAPLNVK